MVTKILFSAAAIGVATLGIVQAAPATTDEIQGLNMINLARQKVGQAPLSWDTTLKEDALLWSGNLAALGTLKHAPVSERKGAGELISMFRTEDRNNIQMTHPISESAKKWLGTDAKQHATDASFVSGNFPGMILLKLGPSFLPLLTLDVFLQSSSSQPRPPTSAVPALTSMATPTHSGSFTLSAVFTPTSTRM